MQEVARVPQDHILVFNQLRRTLERIQVRHRQNWVSSEALVVVDLRRVVAEAARTRKQ
jgi:hypothetical protein